MNRLKSGLATGGLLALALAISPAIPAGAAAGAGRDKAPAPESQSLKTTEQSRAAASASALGLASGEKLTVKSVIADPDGATHVRYERTLDGLRVIGGDFVSHKDASGAVKSVSWNVRKNVTPPTMTPTVSKSQAHQAGLAAAKANKETATPGELVVFQSATGPKLAYEVVTEGIKADQTPTRLHTIVDATTGKTLTSWDDVKEGTGNGIFVGSVSLATSGSSGAYTMKDSHGNYTTDLNQATSGNGTTFTDADDVWGTGSQSNRQSAAVDAHYGAGKTYDYYNTQLGRAGIWNNGTGARSRVHYGQNYSNAFWDGTQMTYGDGAGNAAPLVEIDVAGHEMSHGVTENTAGLAYTGDAGGLNESTSDIFGTAVEWYANNPNDVPDYLIGEKLNLNGNGTPLRYMDKPSKDGASKDCWSSTLGGLDPHYSSGPLNHWYYLASEGSGAKTVNGVSYNSPTCDGSTVTGIGHVKAEKIWYRTLSTYLTSSSNYAAARTGVIKAAKDLYGVGSAECTAVDKAMGAIAAPASTETCGGTTPPPHRWLADQRWLRVRPDRLDRHHRPDHQRHGSSRPQRVVQAVAGRQRGLGLGERVADLRRPVHGHLADPDLLDPDRHVRDDDDHRLRHGHGADQRRHEAELLEPVHAEGVLRPEDDRPDVLQGHERHAEVRRHRGLLAADELRRRRRRDELLSQRAVV